jgi:hypothetical protein
MKSAASSIGKSRGRFSMLKKVSAVLALSDAPLQETLITIKDEQPQAIIGNKSMTSKQMGNTRQMD